MWHFFCERCVSTRALSIYMLLFSNLLFSEEKAEGLVLELKCKDSEVMDFRLDRRVAIRVGPSESPSAFIAPGAFEAAWHGELLLEKRERLYFSFEGSGKAVLLLGGELVLEANGTDLSSVESERLRLNGGHHSLEVRFSSLPSGMGRLRLLWRGRDFLRESVPPAALKYNPEASYATPLKRFNELRRGRFLVASLGCLRCHKPSSPIDSRKGMPEAVQVGPSLLGVGSRLSEPWLAKWVNAPSSVRRHARMPKAPVTLEEARHIAGFLASLRSDSPVLDPLVGDAKTGAGLFAELGCITCHQVKKDEITADDRIDLSRVGEKFLPGALARFLTSPEEHYSWTRMPNFNLSAQEAADIAAFLKSFFQEHAASLVEKADAEKGKLLAANRGCAACHDLPIQNKLHASPMAKLNPRSPEGCISDESDGTKFFLSSSDRAAIRAFLARGIESLNHFSLSEFASRQFSDLRCFACHEKNGKPSLWSAYTPEIAAFHSTEPKSRQGEENPAQLRKANYVPPNLNFLGEKLREDWLGSFFAGKVPDKPRPWIKARMPSFPSRSTLLSKGFSGSCGVLDQGAERRVDKNVNELKKAGEAVVNILCITCHGVAQRKPTAVFEGQGINLLLSSKRLRREHYFRWMMDPYRVDSRTIMPKFADEEGRTGLIDLFEGDAHLQFDAVWHYLRNLTN